MPGGELTEIKVGTVNDDQRRICTASRWRTAVFVVQDRTSFVDRCSGHGVSLVDDTVSSLVILPNLMVDRRPESVGMVGCGVIYPSACQRECVSKCCSRPKFNSRFYTDVLERKAVPVQSQHTASSSLT